MKRSLEEKISLGHVVPKMWLDHEVRQLQWRMNSLHEVKRAQALMDHVNLEERSSRMFILNGMIESVERALERAVAMQGDV
jgi:hypothetical protein